MTDRPGGQQAKCGALTCGVWGLMVTLGLATLLLPATLVRGARHEPLTAEQARQDLERIAAELQMAVLTRDTETLLKYTWRPEELNKPLAPDALRSFVVYEAIRGDLRPDGSLYCRFFDTPCLQAGDHIRQRLYRTPTDPLNRIAIRDFLLMEPGPEIRVIYYPDTGPPYRSATPMVYPLERPRGIGRILYVRRNTSDPVPDDPHDLAKTWHQYWGVTYVGLDLWATRAYGWRYVHETLFNIGCGGTHPCHP